jgi:hypothetical protein
LIENKSDSSIWRFKLELINELHDVAPCWDGSTLIRGDSNLLRKSKEKKLALLITIGPIYSMTGSKSLF